MATSPVKAPPRGRDAILEAVLDAAERLFTRSEPTAVSLRAVAAEAGVTYSLVHRHIGTREALYDSLIARFEERWRERFSEDTGLDEMLRILVGDRAEAGTYLRLLGWSMLGDGEDPSARSHREHSVLHALVPLAGASPAAEEHVAAALSLIFGWRFFSRYLLDALGLPADAAPRVHAHIAAAARRLVET